MIASAFIAASLDGFIAREDGNLDWLHAMSTQGEDYGYAAFMATVDVIVMGRHTYEKVLTFSTWPYQGKRVVVLASRPLHIPPALTAGVQIMSGTPAEVTEQLQATGARHAYVDGGQTVQRFLNAGALQRLIVSRIPVLIGTGIPLFGPTPKDLQLRHVRTQHYPTGLVQSEYEVLDAMGR